MASYSQWAASKNGPSRLTWVCGESRVLAVEVMTETTAAVGADDTEQWRAGGDSEREIWASILALPAAGRTRLTIVRDAGRLRDWDKLRAWLDARALMQGSYVLFESEEHDFPKDADGKLTSPADMLRDSTLGQIVRCSPLNPDDAVAWAIRQLPALSEQQARYLLSRTAGDLGEVRSVLSKARLFEGQVTDEVLGLLCAELPGDFADLLILRNLPGAMLAADALDVASLSHALGYLASRLQLLATLHRAAMANTSRRDVIAKLGVPAFLAQKYTRVSEAEYGESRTRRAWQALSAAEDAHRSGASVGVAEVLVTSWWS